MMIRWIKKIIFVLILAMAGIWIFTQLPGGQRWVRDIVATGSRRLGIELSVEHIDVVLPFYVRLQGITAKDPSRNGAVLATCQTVTFTPLFLDLPFHQLSFLQVRGHGIMCDVDAMARIKTDGPSVNSTSFRFSLALPSFNFQSVHLKSHLIPNDERSIDCSICGSLFLASDFSRGKASLSISRSTPCSWPKRVDFFLSKKNQNLSLISTLFLATDGLSRPKQFLFGPDDQLVVKISGSHRGDSPPLSLSAFDKLVGSWQLACPIASMPISRPISHGKTSSIAPAQRPSIPLNDSFNLVEHPDFSEEYVIQRSCSAHGKLLFLPGNSLSATCDDLKTLITVGRLIQSPSDLEGSSQPWSLHVLPLQMISVSGRGNLQLFGLKDAILHCKLHIPRISVNDLHGSLDGMADFSLREDRLFANASATGSISKNSRTLPVHFAGKGEIGPQTLTLSGDLVSSLFRLSARHEYRDEQKSVWATLRCQDLAIIQSVIPFPIEGSAELFSHVITGPQKTLLSLSGNASDLRLDTIHCKQADLHLSLTPSALQTVAVNGTVIGFEHRNCRIDRGDVALSLNPSSHSLRLLEARASGSYNKLTFDILSSGSGQTDLRHGFLAIDRLEGKIGDDDLMLERPLVLEHTGLTPSHLSASFNIGHEGRAAGQWQRLSMMQGTGTCSLEHIPLRHVAACFGVEDALGTFDGQCHYQASRNDLKATGQAHIHLERLGVMLGREGGIAIGGTASIENGMIKTDVCMAGSGIKEPLVVSVQAPITRRSRSPFFTISQKAPLDGTVKGDIHLSQLLASWMPEDAGFEAIIGCDASVSGTVERPAFSGSCHLREGRIDLLPTGQVITDIQMDGTLNDQRLSFHHISASDDMNGHITGQGIVELVPDGGFRWEANLEGADVQVVDLDYATVIADLVVRLRGDLSSMTIAGSGQAKRALIDLAARFPTNIPELNVSYRNESPMNTSSYGVRFDLSVDAAKNLTIRGRGLSSQWDGHLHLGGTADSLMVDGLLQCLQGSFTLSTKELTISEGSVLIGGNLFKDSRLNVIANISLPSITAQVTLKGSLETPKLAIQSTPPKPDNEILSLILFNKEYGDISPLQSLQLANTAMTLQHSSGPFDLLDRVKETFGIDVIDFGSSTATLPQSSTPSSGLDESDTGPPPTDVQSDVSLKVGKYISDGVAVTVSKNVTSDTNYLGLEAQIAPEIVAGAEVGDDEEGIISLKWKKNY